MNRSKKILLSAYCFLGTFGTVLFAFLMAGGGWVLWERPFVYFFVAAGLFLIAGGTFFLICYRSHPLSRPMWLVLFLGLAFFLISIWISIVF